MELKFDRARFDAGEMPTRTRDGHAVQRIFHSNLVVPYPLAAWVDGSHYAYDLNGRVRGCSGPHALDLVHEPKMRRMKVMLHWGANGCIYSQCSDVPGYDRSKEQWQRDGSFIKEIEVEL